MTKRIPLKGAEQDALTGWRRFIKFRRGERKASKRSYMKRLRKYLKVTTDE